MDFSSLLTSVGSIALVAIFFGGSIFVHELGHFLAARKRGEKVERFSIGFGPAIFKWVGKDGVEYRLSWFPFGGYVALPRLADMSSIEGKAQGNYADLPPPSYATKVIIFSAGAAFNVLFALLLSTVVWWVGVQEAVEPSANQIGVVAKTLTLPDGSVQPSPAAQAGLRPGDVVLAIDGREVKSWSDISTFVTLGAGRTEDDNPEAVFRISRDGQVQDITVLPVLVTREKFRRVGIGPAYSYAVESVKTGSLADRLGLKSGDLLRKLNGQNLYSLEPLSEALQGKAPAQNLTVVRGGQETVLPFPGILTENEEFGAGMRLETETVHPSPFKQIWNHATLMVRSIQSWLHPSSDVGLSKFSGPVGIIKMFHTAAVDGWLSLVWFTAAININLAIFNLLPFPIFDGGHILLATINRLRRRPVPLETVATIQGAFLIILLGTVLYVTVFDVRRLAPESAPVPAAPAKP